MADRTQITRIKNLVEAYNRLDKKENQLKGFFGIERDCDWLMDIKSNVLEALLAGVPDDNDRHYKIHNMIYQNDIGGIYDLINGKAEESGEYRIYISSAAGLDYTGITCKSENEAKELCDKYNEQDNTPYCEHIYRKQKGAAERMYRYLRESVSSEVFDQIESNFPFMLDAWNEECRMYLHVMTDAKIGECGEYLTRFQVAVFGAGETIEEYLEEMR